MGTGWVHEPGRVDQAKYGLPENLMTNKTWRLRTTGFDLCMRSMSTAVCTKHVSHALLWYGPSIGPDVTSLRWTDEFEYQRHYLHGLHKLSQPAIWSFLSCSINRRAIARLLEQQNNSSYSTPFPCKGVNIFPYPCIQQGKWTEILMLQSPTSTLNVHCHS